MAQFDVFLTSVGEFVLDCQTDLLDHLNTRFVVPLLSCEAAPQPAEHLNPQFTVGDDMLVMVTQFAASVPVQELHSHVGNLAREHFTILRALDMLITGI